MCASLVPRLLSLAVSPPFILQAIKAWEISLGDKPGNEASTHSHAHRHTHMHTFTHTHAHPGQQVFWHSSSHILGEAMERHYGGCLCYGPPIENGFYYDMYMEGTQVSSNDFPQLETLCKSIVKEKQPFVRLEMKREDLLEMFKVCVCVYVCQFVYHSFHSTTSSSIVSSTRRSRLLLPLSTGGGMPLSLVMISSIVLSL